ncbi:MAG: DNA-processing protein DprA [Patescibacteria group bacterium]|jgi:DNA processing protein
MAYQKPTKNIKADWDDSRLGWLGCTWFEKFGPKSLDRLQKTFGENHGQDAWRGHLENLLKSGLTENVAQDFINWRQNINLADLSATLDKDGIDFVLPWDLLYPTAFRQTSCPPAALFWRGAAISKRPWIAVVGTRKMSVYGKRACLQIVSELAQAGAGIVSGMALGIDACAHQTALDSGVQTIAVLAGGLDHKSLYPSSNVPLAERILLSGGVIMSEFPPGTPCLRHHFPQRNRLIATLAQAVVVVEAGAESGSVLTAKLALDENRDVFAVPGPITSPGSVGVHELLRQGAQICTGGKDVLAGSQTVILSAPERPPTNEERHILDLCRTSIHVDELTRLLNSSAAVIGATCTTLEMMDALQELEPQTYQITARGKQLLIQPFSQE